MPRRSKVSAAPVAKGCTLPATKQPHLRRCATLVVQHVCERYDGGWSPLVNLVRCSFVCRDWQTFVQTALRMRCVTRHDCYRDLMLDDIHHKDREAGLAEWYFLNRLTKRELLPLGGAAFSFFARVFDFSRDEILQAMLGRAAFVKGYENQVCCTEEWSHSHWRDDGIMPLVDKGDNWPRIIFRDCQCTACPGCASEGWCNGNDRMEIEHNDATRFGCWECGKSYVSLRVGREAEKCGELAFAGMEGREDTRCAQLVPVYRESTLRRDRQACAAP
eukprot:TRINITY_DN65981_c0_g1_i1.p1 TRINITY_DN65981_c0_g1~~TRINITY_DN65981_c0_g1_i1.p1  ORF type:complete len:275 (-),score=5.28 TRINITY_DN65981_c0_g1_i1:77-901(-)